MEELVTKIARLDIDTCDFRIEFIKRSKRPDIHTRSVAIAIADVLEGFPDLDNPRHRFLVVYTDAEVIFGEILSEPDHSYQLHDAKPYRTSCSLPSELTRAIINLVVPPARSILDPCCGTGSILLEALSQGIPAYGSDWNPRMVGMTRKNLAYFSYQAEVKLLDARDCQQQADALVTDLPYGKMLEFDPKVVLQILENAARLCPVGVYITGMDISNLLEMAGYQEVEVFRINPKKSFTRYVYRGRSIYRPSASSVVDGE